MSRLIMILALASVGMVLALAAPPPATVYGADCSVDGSIDAEEEAMLLLINEHRVDNGLAPLVLSATLNKAAAWKSKHMADENYFAHDDTPIGRTWVERIRDCGYTANTWLGENIAAGNESAQETFQQWLNSPGHNANMLNEHYVAIGIGRAYNVDSTYDWYWTTDFGGFDDGYTPPPGGDPAGPGDVSCNGAINALDAQLVLQRTAGVIGSLPCQQMADVNQDGVTDAVDAALILQYATGLVASLPV